MNKSKIVEASKLAGIGGKYINNFFNADTFFGTSYESGLLRGKYFITADDFMSSKKWALREIKADRIKTVNHVPLESKEQCLDLLKEVTKAKGVKSVSGWQDSEYSSFDDYVKPLEEVSEDLYWYFLEILPPHYVNNGFMVSEPYSYCEEHNTQTYACFIKHTDSKYYYLGNISPKAVKAVTEELEKSLNCP